MPAWLRLRCKPIWFKPYWLSDYPGLSFDHFQSRMKALIPEELSLLRTHCIHFCPSSKSSSKMISLLIVLMSVLWRKRTCRCFGGSVPYQSNWTSTVFTFFNRRCFLVWSRPDRLLLLEAVRVTALFPCQGLDSTETTRLLAATRLILAVLALHLTIQTK